MRDKRLDINYILEIFMEIKSSKWMLNSTGKNKHKLGR